MKTFEKCCEEVAKTMGFSSHSDWLERYTVDPKTILADPFEIVNFYKTVSLLYASYKEEEAFKAGFERGKSERNDSSQ
jgi:hypothetical protein